MITITNNKILVNIRKRDRENDDIFIHKFVRDWELITHLEYMLNIQDFDLNSDYVFEIINATICPVDQNILICKTNEFEFDIDAEYDDDVSFVYLCVVFANTQTSEHICVNMSLGFGDLL